MRHCTESKMYNVVFFCYNEMNFMLTEDYVREALASESKGK